MTGRIDALQEWVRAAPPTPAASLRPCAVVLGVGAVLCAAWALVPRGLTSAVLLLVLNALTVGSVFLGVRRFRPGNRSPWVVLIATQTCSLVAFAIWYLRPVVTGEVLPVPSPADALFLLLYTGNAVAVGLLIRRERSGQDRQTLLDVLIFTAALGALSWVFLMAPYTHAAELTLVGKVVSLAYPALDLVLVVLALRLAISGSRTTPAKALLLGWASFQLAADTGYGTLALAGTWTLSSPVMLLWMAGFTCLAAAALHPSMVNLGAPSSAREQGSGQARRTAVVGAVLLLPAVLTVRIFQGDLDDLYVITAASVLVFVLALARGGALSATRTTRADRTALARLVAVFVVCALLPLALLAESSIRLSEKAVESDARARVQTTSTVSAKLVQQEMQGLGQLVAAYAQRQLLTDALGDGTFKNIDADAVDRHLSQLQAVNPAVSGVFVTDPAGRLRSVLPASPAIIGRDFSYRDWYRGAVATGDPYVSEAYTTAVEGKARVVAAASVIRNPDTGKVVGILAALYDLQALQSFSEQLADAQGVSLRITDQRGVVVAAPGADGQTLFSAMGEVGVARALAGTAGLDTGETDGGDELLSAYAPVAGLGWTVTAQVPTSQAYASLVPLRSTVIAIAVLLGQVLLGGLVLMARAQRQRRHAERSVLEREEATRGILDAAADAFVSVDASGVVTSWSGQSERLFGWTTSQACGRPLVDLIIPPVHAQAHVDGLARLARTGVPAILGRRVELVALHRAGHEFPVELVIWPSAVGGQVSYNAFVHDISERKRHEEQLATARDEALDASRMKTEFLAIVSHELRTPMNGVMGMTSLLLNTSLTPQQRDYAETVRASADGLLDLVNDVLDLSKVEAGRLELEILDFELRPVVRDVVHLLATGAADKGVALTADIDDDVHQTLRGDPARLRQVLLNLVGNAVKFTAEGSVHLRVRAGAHAPGAVRLRFEVADTGIGLSPEARGRLFLPFSQADASTTRQYGGTGLGLAISKSLVALLDGEIGVDSEQGVGSTFWFTATFDRGTPAPASTTSALAFVPGQRKGFSGLVLVVDDNATNQKIAVQMLEILGHRADVAADGIEAVAAFGRVPYDLVLMDCRMPLMDGFEATRVIRASEGAGKRTPIVAMTASAMAEDRQRCLDVGMDDYLTKPVRLADVAGKVDEWLHPRQLHSMAAAAVPHVDVGLKGPEDGDDAPVLDQDVVAGLRSLGTHFLARLLPVFTLAAPARLADIQVAVAGGDSLALSTAAHLLRGSAANLGGIRVARVCGRLEAAGVAEDLSGVTDDLRLLEVELASMVAAATALVDAPLVGGPT